MIQFPVGAYRKLTRCGCASPLCVADSLFHRYTVLEKLAPTTAAKVCDAHDKIIIGHEADWEV